MRTRKGNGRLPASFQPGSTAILACAKQTGADMLENISKYWALLTVTAFAIVSLFNIGYFYVIGLHFIGVMDLTNVIYSVGLVLGFLLPPLVALPIERIEDFRRAAKEPDALIRFFKPIKWTSWAVIAFFCVGLFFTHSFLSKLTLFSVTFLAVSPPTSPGRVVRAGLG